MIAYKLCRCGKKIESHLRKCEVCETASKKAINKDYDIFKRDRQNKKFYSSSLWKRLRNDFMAKNPFCVRCGKYAKIIDHITPIKQGGDKLSKDNLQSLCLSCHNAKTKKELRGRGINLYKFIDATPKRQS